MISRTYFQETFYDMDVDIASRFAQAIRDAWLTGKDFEGEKQKGFFLSKKRGFEDKLYIGNIHRIENHLYWNDEELQEDDQIVNVVVIDGPVTRDGDGCSYGSKDHRDQIMYANTIPQVVGHLFLINTPGGAASARIDYEQAIADCRDKGKPTVAWVDGLCCSAGQLVAALCDRTVVMNGRHTMGCIGTMCAFWGVAHNTVDKDGYRYIELVSVTSPDKNAEYREATEGKTEKLQAELDRLGEEFRETVRQNRPLVKEEHLTGKTFEAQDVMGALVDEIGDYNRAIECVFELADDMLPAARTIIPESPEKPDNPDNPENLEEKSNNPQNDTTMTEEEKKAAEVAEQPATTQEEQAPATEQPAEEAPATEAPAVEEEKPAEEEVPATEGTPAQEETTGQAEALATAEAMIAEKDKEIATLKESLATLNGIAEERDKTAEELATALTGIDEKETTIAAKDEAIAERDKTIAEHVATIAAKDAAIAEKDATIEKLTKQVGDLKAEVKELSEKPTPMVNAESGVPADNGAGEAPKVNQHQRIKPGMTYEEIRALRKEGKA